MLNKAIGVLTTLLVFTISFTPVFASTELQRATISDPRLENFFGSQIVDNVNVNQQIQISSDITNLQEKSQAFVYLVQIKNKIGFVVSLIGALLYALDLISDSTTALFFISILIVATGVYAARSLYFAVMQKGQIPLILTGTAVGIISLVGYTPDIFAGPVMGYLLENSPGAEGHQHVFWMLAIFSFSGGIAAWIYFRLYRKKNT